MNPYGNRVWAGVVVVTVLTWCLLPAVVLAGDEGATEQVYQMPPKAIADLIDAPPTPGVSVGPNQQYLLIMDRPNLPPISEVAQPELRLAGRRVNPRTNGPSRRSYYTKLTLQDIASGQQRTIKGIPKDPRIGAVTWSPDGSRIAFIITRENGIELWTAGVATAQAKLLTLPRLNAAFTSAFKWSSDNQTLYCLFVPPDRGQVPAEPDVPAGPVVQENIGKKAPARTYQDLLKNRHDEALFDYYMTSQVMKVTLDGHGTPLGKPGIIATTQPSPDGKYVLAETVHRPYSYLVPSYRFPTRIEVWNTEGQLVYQVADLPLAEDVPTAFASVRTGPRSVSWRADKPATLYWAEAQDGGDPKREAEIRDRVYAMAAPFKGQPLELVTTELRYSGVSWGNDNLALVNEWWWKNRRTRTCIFKPSAPGSEPELLYDRTWEDRYNDPGRPMSRRTEHGTWILRTANDGKILFYTGAGASPEGNRPFLDQLDLSTKETERLWRSAAPHYESVWEILDQGGMKVLTRRESVQEPPNYYVRDVGSGDLRQITNFPHPTPQLKDVYKEMIHYERADGVKLTATLYLPPGKTPANGPFPMLMWAYPREFKSADAAGQVTDSPHRFIRTSTHSALLWLMHGYAVLDNPKLPIVGEGDVEPNDTYVEQLVAGAQAAVDEVVRRGVANPDRIAVGGHSYGAFMAANLLAHCDLFRAGIARSGAYNRTLTPFGFQSEERTFWESPETYFEMSPFTHTDKINEPILLIHGDADNNSGTFPLQSKRFYNALKGHGATARLALLPHESHGYRARESVMHMAWEMTRWLDKYVTNSGPREVTSKKE